MSIGDTLATARRQAGLTITQVSQRTCIRETIVRDIERGDYSACGGDFYARGHIRSIARAVGLEPDELIKEYDATQAPPRPISAADVFQPFTPVKLKERRRPNWTMVLLAGFVVVLAVAGFTYFQSHKSSPSHSHQAATTQTKHQVKQHTQTTPVAQVAREVKITVVGRQASGSWTQISTLRGRVIFMGDVGTVPGARSIASITRVWPWNLVVQLGNPRGVVIYVNGKPQRLHAINPVTITCNKQVCQ